MADYIKPYINVLSWSAGFRHVRDYLHALIK